MVAARDTDLEKEVIGMWKVRHCAISHVVNSKGHHQSIRTFHPGIKGFLEDCYDQKPTASHSLSADLNHPVADDHINIIFVRRPTRELLKIN